METLTPLLALFLGITTAAAFHTVYLFPSVIAYSVGAGRYHKLRPLLIAGGHFLAIILIGFVALGIGLIIEHYLIYLEILAILFILAVGLYLVLAKTADSCGKTCGCKTDSTINKLKSDSLFKSFLFGFSLGLLCVACLLPIFGTIMAMFALVGYNAILLLFSYALGHTLPILAAAYLPYFSEKFAREKIEKNIIILRKIAGLILVIIGLYLFWQLFISEHDHHKENDYHEYYSQLNEEMKKIIIKTI